MRTRKFTEWSETIPSESSDNAKLLFEAYARVVFVELRLTAFLIQEQRDSVTNAWTQKVGGDGWSIECHPHRLGVPNAYVCYELLGCVVAQVCVVLVPNSDDTGFALFPIVTEHSDLLLRCYYLRYALGLFDSFGLGACFSPPIPSNPPGIEGIELTGNSRIGGDALVPTVHGDGPTCGVDTPSRREHGGLALVIAVLG